MEIKFDGELVNLTNLWKAAGGYKSHQPYEWVRLPEATRFIKEVKSKTGIIPVLETRMGRFGGTFAHWQIALAYAKYLSPAEFHSMMANQIIKERFEEEADPDLAYERGKERAYQGYKRMGKDDAWIEDR